jgi:hypothetical protein
MGQQESLEACTPRPEAQPRSAVCMRPVHWEQGRAPPGCPVPMRLALHGHLALNRSVAFEVQLALNA